MTPSEFKAAREEILAGFAKSRQRKLFGLLLGFTGKRPNNYISEKERGIRPITRSDELIIAYLRVIKKHGGHILWAMECVPELRDDARLDEHA